jgi:2'-5' RNA ligase
MRAFLAVELDDDLRTAVARVQDELRQTVSRQAHARITWVRPASMHLTVKFLGEFDEHRADALKNRITQATEAQRRVDIPLSRLGAFPGLQAPRAVWLGPPADWEGTADARVASDLARAIDQACVHFDVEPDRHAWHPHLTLARVRKGERQVGAVLHDVVKGLLALPPMRIRIDAVSLMKSELRPDGPVHCRLWKAGLQ